MRRPLRSELARQIVDLAVDLGDPGRMARARRLDRAGRVGTLDVDPGRLTAVVHDDRRAEVTIDLDLEVATAGVVPPATAIIGTSCSCGSEPQPCRHGLSTLLAFAAEVELEPAVLDEWTTRSSSPAERPMAADDRFDRGSWDGQAAPAAFEPMSYDDWPLIVEGVDAGPVIRDAVATAGRRRRARGRPQRRA